MMLEFLFLGEVSLLIESTTEHLHHFIKINEHHALHLQLLKKR